MNNNLNFLGSTYTEDKKTLLYVVFEYQGQELKWFPKWKDVIDITRISYITEECCHNGKLSHLFENCLSDLIQSP